MNKKLVALVAAAMMSISAGSVFAAENPVEINNSLSIQYRTNTYDTQANKSGTKTTFVSNFKIGLSKNVDFYGRISAQHLTQPGFGNDFLNSEKDNVSFDQAGIIIKGGDNNFVYKIGRQSIALGANETLYSGAGYYGRYGSSDGITVTGKSGAVDLKAVAAAEDSFATTNKVYGLQASYKPSAWTVGATLAKYDQASGNRNYYAVNAGYEFSPKANVMAEYVKSNADADNKAYNIALNYTFDNKLSGYIINHKTEAESTMYTPNGGWEWTAFDKGEKGFYYGLDYQMNKDYKLSVFYKDNKNIKTDAGNTSLRTTLTYKF